MIAAWLIALAACCVASGSRRRSHTILYATLRQLSMSNIAYLSDSAARLNSAMTDVFFRALEEDTDWLPYVWESSESAPERQYIRWMPAALGDVRASDEEMESFRAAHILLAMHAALHWRTASASTPSSLIVFGERDSALLGVWTAGIDAFPAYARMMRAFVALRLPAAQARLAGALLCDLPLSMRTHIIQRAHGDLRDVFIFGSAVVHLLALADPRPILVDGAASLSSVAPSSVFFPLFGTRTAFADGTTVNRAIPCGTRLCRDDDYVLHADAVDYVVGSMALSLNSAAVQNIDQVSVESVRNMPGPSRVRMTAMCVRSGDVPLDRQILHLADALYASAVICSRGRGERLAALSPLHPDPDDTVLFTSLVSEAASFHAALHMVAYGISRMRMARALVANATPTAWHDSDTRALPMLVAAGNANREMRLGLLASCSTAMRTTSALVAASESLHMRLSRDDDVPDAPIQTNDDGDVTNETTHMELVVPQPYGELGNGDAGSASEESYDAFEAFDAVTRQGHAVELRPTRVHAITRLFEGTGVIHAPEDLVNHVETLLLMVDSLRLSTGLSSTDDTRQAAQFIHTTYVGGALLHGHVRRAAGLPDDIDTDTTMPSVEDIAAMLPVWSMDASSDGRDEETRFEEFFVAAHQMARALRLFLALREHMRDVEASPEMLAELPQTLLDTLTAFLVADFRWAETDVSMFLDDLAPATCAVVFTASFPMLVDMLAVFVRWRDDFMRGRAVGDIVRELATRLGVGSGGEVFVDGYPPSVSFEAYRLADRVATLWAERTPHSQDPPLWTVGATAAMLGWNDAVVSSHAFATAADVVRALRLAAEIDALDVPDLFAGDPEPSAADRVPWTRAREDELRARLSAIVRERDGALSCVAAAHELPAEEGAQSRRDSEQRVVKRRRVGVDSPLVRTMAAVAVLVSLALVMGVEHTAGASDDREP